MIRGKLKICPRSHINRGASISVWCDLARLNLDKTFYRHPDTHPRFGFVLLFFDASGFADLIHGALLITHELSVLFYFYTQSKNGVLVLLTLLKH